MRNLRRVRRRLLSDERVRDCALCTHNVFRPLWSLWKEPFPFGFRSCGCTKHWIRPSLRSAVRCREMTLRSWAPEHQTVPHHSEMPRHSLISAAETKMNSERNSPAGPETLNSIQSFWDHTALAKWPPPLWTYQVLCKRSLGCFEWDFVSQSTAELLAVVPCV